MQSTLSPSPGWPSALRSPLFLCLLLPLLWAIAYLPALDVRDMRLEEGRRATPALEMVTSHNYITPTLYSQPYLNKPPLFFYAAALTSFLQGHVNELSVRIPSALSVLIGAYLLLLFARKQLPLETRALAALLLMSTFILLDKGTLGEIDAALSALTFAALVVWWEAYDLANNRLPLWGWLATGFLLGLSALMKGPGGPIEFYAVLLPFLLFSRKSKLLLSPGHLLMILLMLAPVTMWVYALMARTGMTPHTLATLWSDQMHLDALTGGKVPHGWTVILLQHYLPFIPRVFLMLLPWPIPALLASFPKLLRPSDSVRPIWLLCALSAPALILIFWLWPTGNPRYLMMLAYPMATLAAIAITNPLNEAWKTSILHFLRSTAFILILLTLLLIIAPFIIAPLLHSPFDCAIAVAVLALPITFLTLRYTRKSPLEHSPLSAAAAFTILLLVGRGAAASVALPYLATRDAVRILHNQITQLVPPNLPVYTTLTFRSLRGEDYYNPQFYLPTPVQGIDNLQNLPTNLPLTLLLRPDQWPALLAIAPNSQKLGELSAPKGPPTIWIAQVTRP